MAKLDREILKDEERLSGFGVGEPDDDTFSLHSSDYANEAPASSDDYSDSIAESGPIPLNDNIESNAISAEEAVPSHDDKKRKKAFPLMLISGIAAALLLLSLSVIYFGYLGRTDANEKMADDTAETIITEAEAVPELQDETQIGKDNDSSAIIGPDGNIENNADLQAVEEKSDSQVITKPEPITELPADNKAHKLAKPVSEPKSATETKPGTAIVTKKQEDEKLTTQPKVTDNQLATTKQPVTKPDQSKPLEVIKKDENLATVIPESKTETKVPFERDLTKEEYTVQIYSSPSKEDAERWLMKLRAKSINDAFISEQMIRDVTWYRVRFGKFDTRDEARAAALRYGFAQTWIDRVK